VPRHGKNTTVMLGTVNLSPYLDSMDLSVDTDQADTTTFGTTWKSEIAGVSSAKVDYSGLYDPLNVSLPTLFLSLLPGNLTYCPGGGATIGDAARLVSAIDTSFAESSPVGGVVAVKGSFDADGSVGFGAILHPLGEDTNTTVGAERDDATATATGWVAHLHVISVDGGTWTIKLEDAAASNTYSDLTGGAFTGVTTAASQRLQSAAATTALRRYVRYTATRAGGIAGDGITFALAYARNR
jgi:hypothetical protein